MFSFSSLNAYFVTWLSITCALTSSELLQNGGFENSMDNWHCWNIQCEVLGAEDSHDGSHAIRTHNRTHNYEGPSQEIKTEPGKYYQAESWVKILNDKPGTLGQKMELEVSFAFADGTNDYINIAMRPTVRTADGWFFLQGDFQAPPRAATSSSFYYQGPEEGIDYAVDQASVTELTTDDSWRNETQHVINTLRKSDIHIRVTSEGDIDKSAVKIQVLQTRKAFPFGGVVDSWTYVDPAYQKYNDFIHTHFNWAVPGNALKWRQLDWMNQREGQPLYARAYDTITGLIDAGLKVRGHNMVWSVEDFIPISVKAQSGDQLRATVKQHIQLTMNLTKGLLEHWDVNNENLHGQWFQERLQDPDYDLELFRMMYEADPYPKLFLNEYNVVAQGAATSAYLAQGMRFKNASVHMYGMGVQTHFLNEQEPNPTLMKRHLDTLAQVGVPLWATELDASAADENKRADYYEKALRALYGHPAVEGIMFWDWYSKGASNARSLAFGEDVQLTAAGHRVLDLLENEWMTDETRVLSEVDDSFSVRGFHGDYEIRVHYQGRELEQLKVQFGLGKTDEDIDLNIHT